MEVALEPKQLFYAALLATQIGLCVMGLTLTPVFNINIIDFLSSLS